MVKKYFTEEERKEAQRLRNKKSYDNNKKWHKEYAIINKKKRSEYHKNWYTKTHPKKEKLSQEELRVKKREYQKHRRINDPLYKLKGNVRTMISNLLSNRGFTKKANSKQIVGCSFEEFKIYIESKFESWMSWDNYGCYNGQEGCGWDIDHIIPISSAITEEDIITLNHYTNLQPLCSFVNRVKKRNKVPKNLN